MIIDYKFKFDGWEKKISIIPIVSHTVYILLLFGYTMMRC